VPEMESHPCAHSPPDKALQRPPLPLLPRYASHLLIKHSRSQEAATQQLRALREAIASGQQEFEAARHECNCSSASRGGGLGGCDL